MNQNNKEGSSFSGLDFETDPYGYTRLSREIPKTRDIKIPVEFPRGNRPEKSNTTNTMTKETDWEGKLESEFLFGNGFLPEFEDSLKAFIRKEIEAAEERGARQFFDFLKEKSPQYRWRAGKLMKNGGCSFWRKPA